MVENIFVWLAGARMSNSGPLSAHNWWYRGWWSIPSARPVRTSRASGIERWDASVPPSMSVPLVSSCHRPYQHWLLPGLTTDRLFKSWNKYLEKTWDLPERGLISPSTSLPHPVFNDAHAYSPAKATQVVAKSGLQFFKVIVFCARFRRAEVAPGSILYSRR